jgi:cytosine/adenosine deaminase-related metal-dependent hydrolase
LTLRPYGIVVDGVLELGLELEIENGAIQQVRPHSGVPEMFVVSPAFVNAHSHLEYRGLQGVIDAPDYPGWIREITRLKQTQSVDDVRDDCRLAAEENRATGVALILEHSDRPHSGEAMRTAGLDGCIFQEVITFFERETSDEKVRLVEDNASKNRSAFGGPVYLNPHAYQTVDTATLRWLASQETPLSIHVAETPFENQMTLSGEGPIAEFYQTNNIPVPVTGKSVLASLDDLGLVRSDTQLVHCCALLEGDIEIAVRRGATVAHCPRSNARLQCPTARVRRLLNAGIIVGLGLDSAASSGPIDMFAEMRAALVTSASIGEPLTGEEVWSMATAMGAKAAGQAATGVHPWRLEVGSKAPLLKIHVRDALSTEDLISAGSPDLVEWIGTGSQPTLTLE